MEPEFSKLKFQKGGRLLNISQTVVTHYIFWPIMVFGYFGPKERLQSETTWIENEELKNMKEVNYPLTGQLRKKDGNNFFNFFINERSFSKQEKKKAKHTTKRKRKKEEEKHKQSICK